MIKNEPQYGITTREAAKFELALAELRRKAENERDDEERAWLDLFEAALMSELTELRAQLSECDALRSGESIVEPIESLASLPRALIRGRIAAGLSQEELAERLRARSRRARARRPTSTPRPASASSWTSPASSASRFTATSSSPPPTPARRTETRTED